MQRHFILLVALLLAAATLIPASPTAACGGLFCQNSPVNQAAERIIFAKNDDGTITTIVQINYTGDAPDFSWILPLPAAISAEDLAVPDLADEAFTELHRLTDVQIIPPDPPACTRDADLVFSDAVPVMEAEGGVTVFASGEVGPYGFDVIGSEDPNALINWLRQHNYRVDPPMEPLINVYVQEKFAFLAMRLLPEETADSIAPIQITYPGEKPMIPLRLTAVAADPNMGIFVWVFGDSQAVPENYAHMEIADGEITFTDFGGNNYPFLVSQRADALGGRAFITEYAGPSFTSAPNPLNGQGTFNPILNDLAAKHPYMTRLYTVIDPQEMLFDPVFTFDPQAPDISNVRDLRGMNGLYSCEREQMISFRLSDAIETDVSAAAAPNTPPAALVTATPQSPNNLNVYLTWAITFLFIGGIGFLLGRLLGRK